MPRRELLLTDSQRRWVGAADSDERAATRHAGWWHMDPWRALRDARATA